MKIINCNVRASRKNSENIQRNSRNIREDVIQQNIKEAKLDGNNKYFQYLSNLVVIQSKQKMYRRMMHHIRSESQ